MGKKIDWSDTVVLRKLFVFLGLFLFSMLLGRFYRPYVYSNHLNDFHFADFFPSLFSVPVTYSLYDLICVLSKRRPYRKITAISLVTLAFMIYELLELLGTGFDLYDCIAIVAGAVLALLFL